MTYDLAVWHSEQLPHPEEARAIYLALRCAGQFVPPSPAIKAFYQDLASHFPVHETKTRVLSPANLLVQTFAGSMPQDRLTFECCDYCVILNLPYSRGALAVALVTMELAARHGLLCFDPQQCEFLKPEETSGRHFVDLRQNIGRIVRTVIEPWLARRGFVRRGEILDRTEYVRVHGGCWQSIAVDLRIRARKKTVPLDGDRSYYDGGRQYLSIASKTRIDLHAQVGFLEIARFLKQCPGMERLVDLERPIMLTDYSTDARKTAPQGFRPREWWLAEETDYARLSDAILYCLEHHTIPFVERFANIETAAEAWHVGERKSRTYQFPDPRLLLAAYHWLCGRKEEAVQIVTEQKNLERGPLLPLRENWLKTRYAETLDRYFKTLEC